MIRQEFPEKITAFNSKFVKARQIFSESLHVEILKGVDLLGEQHERNHSFSWELTCSLFLRASERIRQAETGTERSLPKW